MLYCIIIVLLLRLFFFVVEMDFGRATAGSIALTVSVTSLIVDMSEPFTVNIAHGWCLSNLRCSGPTFLNKHQVKKKKLSFPIVFLKATSQ